MLLRQMRYFTAVVDCRSFTEAAEQCYISQSAMSQQIQALERELGVSLLSRENRKFSLTPAGEFFYTQSKAVLERVDRLVRETRRRSQEEGARLRIGTLRGYSGMELHQAVAKFSKQCPQASIDIVAGTHEELYDLLRFGGADLVLSDQRRAFSPAYVNYELAYCECYAELSVNHPLSCRSFVDVEELKQLPCILIASREQREAEQEYYQNTLGLGGSYLFAPSLEDGRLLVAGNRGFLPVESASPQPPVEPSIHRVPVWQRGKPVLRNYCAFWRKDQPNPLTERFAEILRECFQESEGKTEKK